MSLRLSILDLAPVGPGQTPRESFAASVELARAAERLGYRRVWYAEHHNMASIASSATSVLIGHVADHTTSIRLGAGGVMLPIVDNIVGWFGTVGVLEALRRRAVEGGSYRVRVSLTRVCLWLISLGILDKEFATTTAGSTAEHSAVPPELFTANTPLGTYQGMTDQIEFSSLPQGFTTTVLQPMGADQPEWS